jgi:hypothetical protein
VIVQRDHLAVVLLHVPHQLAHHLAVPNREKNDQLAEVAQIEQALHVKSLKGVKSAIHAGFGLRRKNATNLELDLASSNQISLKTLPVKSSRRACAQNF